MAKRRKTASRVLVGVLGVLLIAAVAAATYYGLSHYGSEQPQTQQQQPQPKPTPAPSPVVKVAVYFARSTGGQEILERVNRTRILHPDTPEKRLQAAMEELLAGPTAAEKKRGLYSSVPKGVKLHSVGIQSEKKLAVLDFSERIQQVSGSAAVGILSDQLARTACAVDDIKGVLIKVDGKQVGTDREPFTTEGLLFEQDGILRPR